MRQDTTMQLAEWAASLRAEDLPDAVLHHARRALVDHLAATVAGSSDATAILIRDHLSRRGIPGTATVLGTSMTLAAPDAASANGVASHVLEVDDGFTAGSFHPGGPVVAAVLALADENSHTSIEMLRAIVVGYEIGCRIASASHPQVADAGFHNTSTVGVFAGAAGVAALYRLGAADFASSLGIAGSHASGLFEFLTDGASVKKYHPGMAAKNGLTSVELVLAGLVGPSTVLEGPAGYAAAFARSPLHPGVTDNLGSRWLCTQTYFKPYPCCRHVHAAVDAVLELRSKHEIAVDHVSSIHVATYPSATRYDKARIRTNLDAQMSLQYCVAVALLEGPPTLADFGPSRRKDSRVQKLIERTSITVGQGYAERYPTERPARVTVTVGSAEYTAEVSQPLGEPSNPLTDAGLSEKFLRLVSPVLGETAAGTLLRMAWNDSLPRQLSQAARPHLKELFS